MGGGRGGGGGGAVPRDFTHNFCCYGNRSVCLHLLRAAASSGATKSGNFSRALLECGQQTVGMFTPKIGDVWWGCDRERRRVCKYALMPGACSHQGGARGMFVYSTQHSHHLSFSWSSQAEPQVWSSKGSGKWEASSRWRNYEMCLLPKHLFYVLWKQVG